MEVLGSWAFLVSAQWLKLEESVKHYHFRLTLFYGYRMLILYMFQMYSIIPLVLRLFKFFYCKWCYNISSSQYTFNILGLLIYDRSKNCWVKCMNVSVVLNMYCQWLSNIWTMLSPMVNKIKCPFIALNLLTSGIVSNLHLISIILKKIFGIASVFITYWVIYKIIFSIIL